MARHNSSVKGGMPNRALTQQELSPSKRGTPEEVAARDYEAVKGKKLHDQLKKSQSGSSPL
jgi:hypothetical protein